MSSIEKILGAAVSNSLEISPALANLNFDFSLYKVEAPKEFESVGAALSTLRRDEAENGLPHITARKLGALFQRILPHTPLLLNAYGRRASEISEAISIDDGERNTIYGVFGSRVGADATSIWAAATSGPEAIAVHLLACILAKMWESPEATSIWVEIIAKRKHEIRQDFEEKNVGDLASLLAAKQQISREQIRRWDASARAWLRAADAVKVCQVKQLALILDNTPRPVNAKKDTYESVMSAWKSSLVQMEDLINGISRRAADGAILLALGAWHLFPDMVIVDPVAHVQQGDATFSSGGVLTIGLEKYDSTQTGVFWSLPLAHLRHYGAPVVSQQTIDSTLNSRITPEELLFATLGSVLEGWGKAGSNTLQVITWLSRIHDLVHFELRNNSRNANLLVGGEARTSWFVLLLGAANFYLTTSGVDRSIANKLISVGRRYGKKFMALPAMPLFKMIDHGAYVYLMKETEDQIQHLRSVAASFRDSMMMGRTEIAEFEIFIRYKRKIQFESSSEMKSVYEYATALPRFRQGTKRDDRGNEKPCSGHCRWIYGGGQLERVSNADYHERLNSNFQSKPTNVPRDFIHWHRANAIYSADICAMSDRDEFSADQYDSIRREFPKRVENFSSQGEDVFKREDQSIEDFALYRMGIYWPSMGLNHGNSSTPFYRFLFGERGTAALFVIEGKERLIDINRTVEEDTNALFELFNSDRLNRTILIDGFLSTFRLVNMESDPYHKSLKAISTVAGIYAKFPKMSIDIRVLQFALFDAKWIPPFRSDHHVAGKFYEMPPALEPYYLSREQTFACITMFDSGTYNIDTGTFSDVMALSSGDIIYVAATLLVDPSQNPAPSDIKQIPGNIGHPGIALLRPPSAPMIRAVSVTDWKESIGGMFDGTMRDSFKSTSLHLSLTGARFPVDTGFSGGQDVEVSILETLISVHDHGKWVADLDVLRGFESLHCEEHREFRKIRAACIHHQDGAILSVDTPHITAIDNWLALIDHQDQFNFVQTHENWQARLAAATLSLALGHETIVMSEKAKGLCWNCFTSSVGLTAKSVTFIG